MITKRRQRRKRMQILSQFGPADTSPKHVPLSRQTPFVVKSGIRLVQLTVERITKAKVSIIKHLAYTHDATSWSLPPSSLTKLLLLKTIRCTPAFPLPQEAFYPGNISSHDDFSRHSVLLYGTLQFNIMELWMNK